jgi:predicted O-methyltransferase YrrM
MFNPKMAEVPAMLLPAERALLYALVMALQPKRILEIGTATGGSAMIMVSALNAGGGGGRILSIDPQSLVRPEHWRLIESRVTLLNGYSPDILPEAARVAGAPFDFAFIDGMHTEPCVTGDINGIVPFLADSAYLLFHDAHFEGTARAIEQAVSRYGLIDCGLLSVAASPDPHNHAIKWGGMRLVRFSSS